MRIVVRASLATCAVLLAGMVLLFLEMRAPAVGIHLGVQAEDLGLVHDLGRLSLLLNGAFALLAGAIACFAVAKHRRGIGRTRGYGGRRSFAALGVSSPPPVDSNDRIPGCAVSSVRS
jgi:hypothetical protein